MRYLSKDGQISTFTWPLFVFCFFVCLVPSPPLAEGRGREDLGKVRLSYKFMWQFAEENIVFSIIVEKTSSFK